VWDNEAISPAGFGVEFSVVLWWAFLEKGPWEKINSNFIIWYQYYGYSLVISSVKWWNITKTKESQVARHFLLSYVWGLFEKKSMGDFKIVKLWYLFVKMSLEGLFNNQKCENFAFFEIPVLISSNFFIWSKAFLGKSPWRQSKLG
jgi:hypothetical protein